MATRRQIGEEEMEVEKVFRNLVTNRYMSEFDYRTRFKFKTVFYISPYSYCCCPCGFQHEFVDYINDDGSINEEVYDKIVQSIVNGKCPHVSGKVEEKRLTETSLSAVHIATAAGTQHAEEAAAAAEEQATFTDPKNVYKVFNVEGKTKYEGLFNLRLHDIALIKRKYQSANFHSKIFTKYWVNHDHSRQYDGAYDDACLYIPLKITNSVAIIKKARFLELIVQTKEPAILKGILESEYPHIRPLTDIKEDLETFHYALNQGLIEQEHLLSEIFNKANLSKYRIRNSYYLLEYAISYNHPAMIKEILMIIKAYPKQGESNKLEKYWRLCHILNRQDCMNIFSQYIGPSNKSFSTISEPNDITVFLFSLEFLKSDTANGIEADVKEEISTALKRQSDIQEVLTKYLPLTNSTPKNLRRLIIDLCIITDTDKIFKDEKGYRAFKGNVKFCMCVGSKREQRNTAKLCVEINFDLDQLTSDDIHGADAIIEQSLKFDILEKDFTQYPVTYGCREILSLESQKSKREYEFQTDMQEHGFWLKNEDFIMNYFTTPFLLECGLPTSRQILEQFLEEPEQYGKTLHSMEEAYLRHYIQENFVGVKPLMKICRKVLRKHFKGLKIHKFLEMSGCPKKIKDYILMAHLLQ